MPMMSNIKRLWPALLAWLVAATGCEEPSRPPAWNECQKSSNWAADAGKRMMNVLSPHFDESKVEEYLDWQRGRGVDHVHILLVNQSDGEGGGYDALGDADDKALALKRVKAIRDHGLGCVLWIVADDSDSFRKRIFHDPGAYARSLADFFPYASYLVLGLEMDEGHGSMSEWIALRDAILSAGWCGPIATHHRPGRYAYASLGEIVMDQLRHDCSESDVAASVSRLRRRGLAVCGFEYARNPAREKARAALDAGAFGVGNW